MQAFVARRAPSRAFSLVEVVISLGIFSFCIMGIIYLLGSALESSRQSQRDSALGGVLRSMDAELRSLPYTNAAGLSLATLTGSTYFYFDNGGNRTTNPASYSYRVAAIRVDPATVAAMTLVTNGSPGATNSTNHYLWALKVAHPPPNFPLTNSLILGRSLYGSGLTNLYE